MRHFRNILLLSTLILFVNTHMFPQIAVENFEYPAGQLTDLNSGANVSGGKWVGFSGTGKPVMVVAGSLSYDRYPSSGVGNKIEIKAVSSSAEDVYLPFDPIPVGGVVHVSFLISVADTVNLRTEADSVGDYFVALLTSTSTSTHIGRISIRRAPAGNAFQLGIRAGSQNTRTEWGSTNLLVESTHLVVMRYSLVAGAKNDTASLWINPDLQSPQGPPSASQIGASTSEPADIARIVIRQDGTDTPDGSLDGIRVGRSWLESPLPIQLTSLTATRLDERHIRLTWVTQSEIQNYGFEVQRGLDQTHFVTLTGSFIPGAGSTLVQQTYTYTDSSATRDSWWYRLVQHDLDGTAHYSHPVAAAPLTSVLLGREEQYGLLPNFPNPFNPKTAIPFSVARSGRVRLCVFNVHGQLVATLFDEWAEAGRLYDVDFSGASLASGVYVSRLSSGTRTETRRMLLLK